MKKKTCISKHLCLLMTLIIPLMFILTGCNIFESKERPQQTTTAVSTTKTEETKPEETKPEETTAAETSADNTEDGLAAEEVEETDDEDITEDIEEIGDDEISSETDDREEDTEIEVGSVSYHFRSKKLLNQHYEKHGKEMGFASAAEYEKAASDVINSLDALFKLEAEDGDGVYYIEETNEFAILSTDGYIRTYFKPSGGKKYFDKQ